MRFPLRLCGSPFSPDSIASAMVEGAGGVGEGGGEIALDESGAVDQVCGENAEPKGQDGARGGGFDKGVQAREPKPKEDDGAIGNGEEWQERDGERANEQSEQEERRKVIGEAA